MKLKSTCSSYNNYDMEIMESVIGKQNPRLNCNKPLHTDEHHVPICEQHLNVCNCKKYLHNNTN